jgi:hypothetical protein
MGRIVKMRTKPPLSLRPILPAVFDAAVAVAAAIVVVVVDIDDLVRQESIGKSLVSTSSTREQSHSCRV